MSKTAQPKFFCPAPFKNLVQDYQGRCGPCPYASGDYDYKDVPISKRWSAEAATKLREEYLAGEKPDFCKRCHIEEEAGMKSRRNFELGQAPNYWNELETNNWEQGPEVMVLRISNICNFACRTCHALDSSKFNSEGEYYAKTYGDKENRYISKDPRTEFSLDNMDELYALSKNLKTLEFYGGEPLLNESHEKLLKLLIEDGRAKEIELFYCTNGSITPSENRLKLWAEFKSIRIGWSLDGIEDFFHYIRWPGNWKETRERIIWYRDELSKKINTPITNTVNVTVSALNIFNLDEIIIELDHILKLKVGMTIVHEPAYYNPQILPANAKAEITKRLTKPEYRDYFKGILNFMNQEIADGPELYRKFLSWTLKKDRYRQVSFEKAFPAYYEFLKEDLSQESAQL